MKALRPALIALFALSGLAAGSSTPALAGNPPFSEEEVRIVARDREIGAFVQEFFSAASLSASIDPQVRGKVNGRFEGSPASVWQQLSRAFNLVAYYDGAVVRIFPAARVESRNIAVPGGRAGEVLQSVNRSGLADSVNNVRVTSADNIMASGVPIFLEEVQRIAGALPPAVPVRRTAEIAPPGTGMPRQVEQAGRMLEPYELRVFYLQYARADSTLLSAGGREVMVPGVGVTISRIMGDGADVRGDIAASYDGRTLRQSQPRLGGRGLDSIPPDGAQLDDDEYLGLPRLMPVPVIDAQPARADPAGPRIAVDPSLNAVIVRDRPENMPAYEGLVEALDIEPQIVELEATIIDLNIDRLRELGIDWRIQSEGFRAAFGNTLRGQAGDAAGAAGGLSLRGVIGSNREFIGRVNALEEEGAARIVSRPQLVTLSNVEAVFDRTRTFYVRVAGDRQVDLFNVTAGTVLRVTPHVIMDGGMQRIRMVIEVEDGSVLDSEVDDIPSIERASVNTQALINNGEGLLLGGLTVNTEYDAESGIPLLKDIPVIGNLFKSQSRRRQRIERLFLITPRLISLDTAIARSAETAAATPQPALQASAYQ